MFRRLLVYIVIATFGALVPAQPLAGTSASGLVPSDQFSAGHEPAVTPPLDNYKLLRGFSSYDNMPRTHAPNDVSSRSETIASHRSPGANTITLLFYTQTKQAGLTERFLREHVLSVDIFALRREAAGTVVAPLSVEQSIGLNLGEKVTVEVVEFNCKAAHTYPPQT